MAVSMASSIKGWLNNRMTVENGGDHRRITEGKRCTWDGFGLIVISDLISANKSEGGGEVTTTVRMEYL